MNNNKNLGDEPRFTIEEIRHYMSGLCLVGTHKENDMLNCAISLIDDYQDGIEAATYRNAKEPRK